MDSCRGISATFPASSIGNYLWNFWRRKKGWGNADLTRANVVRTLADCLHGKNCAENFRRSIGVLPSQGVGGTPEILRGDPAFLPVANPGCYALQPTKTALPRGLFRQRNGGNRAVGRSLLRRRRVLALPRDTRLTEGLAFVYGPVEDGTESQNRDGAPSLTCGVVGSRADNFRGRHRWDIEWKAPPSRPPAFRGLLSLHPLVFFEGSK